MVQRSAFALPSLLWRDDYGWHNATALACLRLRHHKRHLKYLAKTFIACFLLTLALPATAQNEIVTVSNWRVHAGDNPAWARPDFDDSQWQEIPWIPSFGPHCSWRNALVPGGL